MAYQKTVPTPTDASIILTYRCPMKCKMCNIWFNPTNKSEEIKASDLRTLPKLKFINLTGGEPFVREDLAEIVEECYRHTDRIVISTSGWFEDRVVALAKKFPNIGIRISIEGLSCKNGTCGWLRQGTSHTADIEGNGAEGYRFRLHGV